jgi:hypothetical protein
MIRLSKWLVLGGLLAAGIVMAIGCERSGRPPIEVPAVAGDWIELVEAGAPGARTPAVREGEKKEYRHISLNADNTFVLTLQTKAGTPAKDANKVEGTWTLGERNLIIFTVMNNTFPEGDPRRDWEPVRSLGVVRRTVAGKGEVDVLTVEDQTGPVSFVRAN